MTPRHLPILLALAMYSQACDDALECPAGTRKAGTACQKLDQATDGTDAAVSPDAEVGQQAGQDAELDAGPAPASCYLDYDHDGVGSGEPVSCADGLKDAGAESDAMAPAEAGDAGDGGDAGAPIDILPPARVTLTGDCDDDNPKRAPGLAELCDGSDNDCDDAVDEESKNACGGECVTPFEHEIGERCDNGQVGACLREGAYICDGDTRLICTATPIAPSTEVCGDDIDNDCDGETNESDAGDAKTWYKDCDGDTYSASAEDVKACIKPANAGTCTWTNTKPDVAAKKYWDCNDSKVEYKPGVTYGFPPEGSSSWDLNCDGTSTPAPSLSNACSAAYVARLNDVNYHCEENADPACITWKGADGKYKSAPPSKCPDSKVYLAYRVSIQSPSGGAFFLCKFEEQAASWPCR